MLNLKRSLPPRSCLMFGCCPIGTYAHSVAMPVKNRVVFVDYCIADIVAGLNATGLETIASCCGHGIKPAVISLADGREITISRAGGD